MNRTRLIVNADDFGAGPGRNRGIVEAFLHGLVTAASLLANGPAFADAVTLAAAHRLPVGVHLNLSEGPALTGALPGLTDAAGNFLGKPASRRAFADLHLDLDAVRRELEAQLQRVLETGLQVSHLDSHQHWMLFPRLTALLLDLAEDYSIPALRLPLPMEPAVDDPPPPLGQELVDYRRLAPAVRRAIEQRPLTTPMGLFGMPLLDRLDLPRLLTLLDQLPAGTWELMVHPGYADPGDPFGGPAREIELRALTAPESAQAIEARGIELIGFAELACAC